MRILHVAYMRDSVPGVDRQMDWERRAASELGIEWTTTILSPNKPHQDGVRELLDSPKYTGSESPLSKARQWTGLHREFYSRVVAQSSDYDVVMIRHCPFDPLRAQAMKKIKAVTLSVHHTMEVAELRRQGGIGGIVAATVEGVAGSRSLEASSGVVGVTEEIVRYQQSRTKTHKPGLVYPNGALVDMGSAALKREAAIGRVPVILFAAAEFRPWHGLDRLLKEMSRSSESFQLHLVGKLSGWEHSTARQDGRVVVHGLLSQRELLELTSQAWVGLSSFAMDRNGLTQGSTLKVREYLAAGVPVFSGHGDFLPPDFPYYRVGPPVLRDIVKFAWETRDASPQEIAGASLPFIDKRSLMSKFVADVQDAFF